MATHFYGDGCPEHDTCEGYETEPGVIYHAHDLPRCKKRGTEWAGGRWLCETHAAAVPVWNPTDRPR